MSWSWEVEFHPDCEKWAESLAQADAEALLAALNVLRDRGPGLGRPLVDSIHSSRHRNLKELRPGSTGRTEVRVLFAFDGLRRAILLLGGDKSRDWSGWYEINVPIADDRLDEHQSQIGQTKKRQATKDQTRKGRRRQR